MSLSVISSIDKDKEQHINLVKGDCFEGKACDISAAGVGVHVKYFLPKGLVIKMELEGKPFGLNKKIKVKGAVRHCVYIKIHTYKCGIEFLDLPADCKKAITQFILTYEKRKKPRLNLPS